MEDGRATGSRNDVILNALKKRFGQLVSREELLRLCAEAGHPIDDERLKKIKHEIVKRDNYVIEHGEIVDSSGRKIPAYQLIGYPAPRRELPQPPERFYGRDTEVQAVVEHLRPGVVVTLHGVHGYGKSAIAKAVIRRFTDRPAGWLTKIEYLGLTPDHRDERCIPMLAKDLGIPQSDAVSELKNVLSQRGRLVVIDQAEFSLGVCRDLATDLIADGNQVAVLVTSAVQLGIDDERCVPVAGLDCGTPGDLGERVPDAVRLFLDHVPKAPDPSPQQIEWIAEHCRRRRGNPLVISLAAHGLDGFRGLQDLADVDLERDFLKSVRNELRGFSEPQQTALARLSLLHSPWSLDDETARVVGVGVDDLNELLAPFVGAAIQRVSSVLDRELPRFEMEPSVQVVAREKLNGSRKVQGDAIDEVLALVDVWLTSEPGAQARTFWRIARNYGTIMHAFSLVEYAPAVTMAERLLPFWQARGLFVDADEVLGRLREPQKGQGPVPQSGRRLRGRGLAMRGYVRCFMQRGSFDGPAPAKLLSDALKASASDPMTFGLAHLALTILSQDEQHLRPCANHEKDLPPWIAADICTQRGWAHYRASRFAEAEAAFKEARKIARDVEPRSDGDAMLGLAWVARRQCYIETAEDWADAARRVGKQLQDVTLTLDAINARIEFFVARGRSRKAQDELDAADRLLLQGGIERIRGRIEGSRGQVLRASATTEPGLERPRELAKESLAIAERLNLRQDQMWRHFDLGNIASLSGDLAQARESFERGRALAVDPALGPPDRWQESRFRQRLARLQFIEGREQVATSTAELLDVADLQLALGVLDDLTWTLVDLEVAAVERDEHRTSEMLRGGRVALCGGIKVGMSRKDDDLKSFDQYSDRIKEASDAVKRVLDAEAQQAAHAIGEAATAGAPQDVTGLKRLLAETRATLLPDA